MKATKENFFMGTKANFIIVEKPKTKADYTSFSGSQYWYTEYGVIRNSDHWGRWINSCDWFLESQELESENPITGFCKWEDFNLKDFIVNVYFDWDNHDYSRCESFKLEFKHMKNNYIEILNLRKSFNHKYPMYINIPKEN